LHAERWSQHRAPGSHVPGVWCRLHGRKQLLVVGVCWPNIHLPPQRSRSVRPRRCSRHTAAHTSHCCPLAAHTSHCPYLTQPTPHAAHTAHCPHGTLHTSHCSCVTLPTPHTAHTSHCSHGTLLTHHTAHLTLPIPHISIAPAPFACVTPSCRASQ
jgi:hypothetical protein